VKLDFRFWFRTYICLLLYIFNYAYNSAAGFKFTRC